MERPKRATRKEVNYRESARVVNVDEEQETVNTTEQGAAKRSLSRDNSWGDSRGRSTESVWGGSTSEGTETSEFWSPRKVERRTEVLLEGVEQL